MPVAVSTLTNICRGLLLIVFFIFNCYVYSQQKINTEPVSRYCKNLPAEIGGICRTSNGMVWFTTAAGVFKYNGSEAFPDPYLPKGQYGVVREISPDVLAMVYGSNVIVYNTLSGDYHMCKIPYIPDNDLPVYCMEKGNKDTVFLINKGRAFILEVKNNKPNFIKQLPQVNRAYYFEYDQTGTWLYSYTWEEVTTRIQKINNLRYPVKAKVASLYNVFRPAPGDNDIENYPVNVPMLINYSTFNDLPPTVKNWMSTRLKWRDSSDIIVEPAKQHYKTLYKDHLGYWWVLTNSNLFVVYPSMNYGKRILRKMTIRDFVSLGNGEKLVGADEDLCVLDKTNSIIKRFPFRVFHMYRHNTDSVLVSSDDQLLGWFDRRNHSFKLIEYKGPFFFLGAMASSNPGKILIHGSGIMELDVHSGKLTKLLTTQSGLSPIFRCAVRSSDDVYLMGCNLGLYSYDRSKNTLKKLRNDFVLHITAVKKNLFALGTLQHGVIIVDQNGNDTKKIKSWPFQGLARNVYCVVTHNNNIWGGTGNGLIRYNLNTGAYNMFNAGTGSVNVEYNTPGAHIIDDSMLWFAGQSGISIMNPLRHESGNVNQRAFIAELLYFNKTWELPAHIKSDNATQKFLIPAGVNEIEFEPGIEDFVHKQFYEIQYRIASLNKSWTSVLPFQTVRLSNLKHGTYKIEFRVINLRNGQISPSNYYDIEIDNFWYQSGWANAGLVVLLLSAVLLIVKTILSNIKRNANRENNILRAEIKTLSAQIDPHFLANLMTSAQAHILGGNQEEAAKVIDQYGALMRKKFEHGHRELTNLKLKLEFIENYINVACRPLGKSFNYTLNLELENEPEFYIIPSDIIQPVIENVFKHAWKHSPKKEKELRISIISKNKKLEIEIADNGINMSNETKQHHEGSLQNIKQRLKLYTRLYNRDFTIHSKSGSFGTVVKIVLDCSVFKDEQD